MASISAPPPPNLNFPNAKSHFLSSRRPSYHLCSSPSALRPSTLCRCSSSDSASPSDNWRWDSAFPDALKNAIKRLDSYVSLRRKELSDGRKGGIANIESGKEEDDGDEDWDWERWRKHFQDVDEQERVVSILKSQLGAAVRKEDYEDAARLKVALAAAAANDTVGRVIACLKRAVDEERYQDAAFIRDNAGAGLVGWWAGISKDHKDPFGRIIHITAEHGRYLARSFSPRQLHTAAAGAPLFEIYFTVNKKGVYRQQAVYLKQEEPRDPLALSGKIISTGSDFNRLDSTEEKNDLLVATSEDADEDDDEDNSSDSAEGLSGVQNILSDMVPGVKFKVLKITAPEKVDRDIISEMIEQIGDEESDENDEKDFDVESVETDDESMGETVQKKDEIEADSADGLFGSDKPKELKVEVVINDLEQKPSGSSLPKDLVRVPAKLEKKGRMSFSFSIEREVKRKDSRSNNKPSSYIASKLQSQGKFESFMFDLAKLITRERLPLKVLKEISELINFSLSQAQSRKPLSGSTVFNRIEMPTSSDPLNGLYIGTHGIYSSEVIQLKRRYGQWKEDGKAKEPPNLEFYEYVEALKLTGDPYVPAGQVAFRAKVGKRYQLPHKGIIPEEFGVIARYRGQGRLAEPGFKNPRWVDGELIIFDGKYVKGGPVVGFVYGAPEYQFLLFFKRLKLQE